MKFILLLSTVIYTATVIAAPGAVRSDFFHFFYLPLTCHQVLTQARNQSHRHP
jgi:hypothetical protein